jgi:BASS family bile acid:Na+ symporter
LNFGFWAGLLPETSALLQQFEISFTDMLSTVSLLLILPLAAGMLMRRYAAALSAKIEKPVRWISIFILIGFIAMALKNNSDTFKTHLYLVFVLVVLHNATASALGYLSGKLMHLPESDRRSVCIETGIQNSGLGLIIIFTFFDGNGGMALIAAWWGVWHIVSGLILSLFFKKASRPLKII